MANLIIDAKDATAHALASIGTALQFLSQKPAAKFAATAAAMAAMAPANAALIPDGALDADYINHANIFQGSTLWLKYQRPDDSFGYASAVRLNDYYALTAAHNVHQSGVYNTLLQVGNGSNFYSNQGDVRNVASVLVNPGYLDNATLDINSIDLAIIKFDSTLSGNNLSIGSMTVGETYTGGGFGVFGTPSGGFDSSQDGNRRAFDAPVSLFEGYYSALSFAPWNQGLNGRASVGDSGSGVFDSFGNLVAINDAASYGHSSLGFTHSLRLSDQEPWIRQNTQAVPEAPSYIVFGIGFASIAFLRRKPS